MPNEVELADLQDHTHDANQLGTVGSSGAVYRSHHNQTASVVVTDQDNAVYVSDRFMGPWIKAGAQKGSHDHSPEASVDIVYASWPEYPGAIPSELRQLRQLRQSRTS